MPTFLAHMNLINILLIPFNINRKGFSDNTGAFQHNSSKRNLYIMVMYDYDSNAIISETIKNRQAATIRDAFLKINKFLKARGRDPKVYIMYNKCYSYLKEAMKKYGIVSNWLHRTCTDKMQQNEQSELAKTTSSMNSQRQI